MHRGTTAGARLIVSSALVLLAVALLPGLRLLADPIFEDSGQRLGGDTSNEVLLADLDQDGDPDAFVANGLGNRVWINQGAAQGGQAAVFQDSAGSPGLLNSRGAALADLDGNQTVDAFVANAAENEIWLNNGAAQFSLKQQLVSAVSDSYDAALGLLNDDAFPDAFIANNGANEVWLNLSDGTMSVSQDELGSGWSRHVVLGDVNNDGALDAYVANGTTFAQADELWINNGEGVFALSAQSLDTDWNEGAALGDLDGDGDLDLFLAAWFGQDSVWFNQGGAQGGQIGLFSESSQALSATSSTDVFLTDVDLDHDLDAVITKFSQPNEVWLNDGAGHFTDSGQRLGGNAGTYAVAASDLDLDQDVDLFFANFGANHVFLQGGLGPPSAWFNVDARNNAAGSDILPWVKPGDALLPILLSSPAPEQLDVQVAIVSEAQSRTQLIPISAGASTAQLAVPNPQPVVSETMTLSLSVTSSLASKQSLLAGLQKTGMAASLVNPLDLIFLNEDSGPRDCLLCMIDWVLKQTGFEPSFWQLHHVQLEDLRASPAWSYYEDQFKAHNSELSALILGHPALLWHTFDVLAQWTPGVVQADKGQGDAVTISGAQAQETGALLQELANEAGPALSHRIQSEAAALDVAALGGLSMNAALGRVEQRIRDQIYLPAVARQN